MTLKTTLTGGAKGTVCLQCMQFEYVYFVLQLFPFDQISQMLSNSLGTRVYVVYIDCIGVGCSQHSALVQMVQPESMHLRRVGFTTPKDSLPFVDLCPASC